MYRLAKDVRNLKKLRNSKANIGGGNAKPRVIESGDDDDESDEQQQQQHSAEIQELQQQEQPESAKRDLEKNNKSKVFERFIKEQYKFIKSELSYYGKHFFAKVYPLYENQGGEIGEHLLQFYKSIPIGTYNTIINIGMFLYYPAEDKFLYYYPNNNQVLINRYLIRRLNDIRTLIRLLHTIDLIEFGKNFAPMSSYIFISIASCEIKFLKIN